MKVKLISITKSHVEGKELSPEELLVYIARVSNPSNQLNTETADKLLGYLIKNKHWSPFDMVNMTVEVTTSRAIAQQIIRHWSIKIQEFSQRYAEVVNIEPVQLRKQGQSNRQGGEEEFDPEIDFETTIQMDGRSIYKKGKASEIINQHILESQRIYKQLISAGVAKECARMVLPLTTQTTIYLNGSVRSWIHYLEQRTDLHAQTEHRQVAEKIKMIFTTLFPNISKHLQQ